MALREKTIEYMMDSSGVITDALAFTLDPVAIHIPEANPFFLSVFVEVGFRDMITVTGGTITEHRVGLEFNQSGSTTWIINTADIGNTGESLGGVLGPFDFTSTFASNWSGTSNTLAVRLYFDWNTGTTLSANNLNAKIYITYRYDDTAPTQIKTVRLPLQSILGAAPTVANSSFSLSTPQIPILYGASGAVLPEQNVVIRDYFFVIETNHGLSNTNDVTMSTAIDGGQLKTHGVIEGALTSMTWGRHTYRPAVIPDLATTHDLQLWSSQANRLFTPVVTLVITYEFTLAGTTRTLNSLIVPLQFRSPLGVSGVQFAEQVVRDVYIQDPGVIETKMSAVRINYLNYAPQSISASVNGSSIQTFSCASGGANCGQHNFQIRFDDLGITLSRGKNPLNVRLFANTVNNNVTNVNGYILVNYISDVAPAGIGANSKSILKVFRSWDPSLTDIIQTSNLSLDIIEESYWLISSGFNINLWMSAGGSAICMQAQAKSGEFSGSGFEDLYLDAYQSNTERSCTMTWVQGREVFKRCPQDALGMNVENLRNYRIYSTISSSTGVISLLSYHSYTWTIAGVISGHDVNSPIDLELIEASTGKVFQRQTLDPGVSTYSFVSYDNTEDYYVMASQGGTKVGRSRVAKAS